MPKRLVMKLDIKCNQQTEIVILIYEIEVIEPILYPLPSGYSIEAPFILIIFPRVVTPQLVGVYSVN